MFKCFPFDIKYLNKFVFFALPIAVGDACVDGCNEMLGNEECKSSFAALIWRSSNSFPCLIGWSIYYAAILTSFAITGGLGTSKN